MLFVTFTRVKSTEIQTRPWLDGRRWPGMQQSDMDGDGRVLSMRIRDPHGAWVPHPKDSRVMIPVDHVDSPVQPLSTAVSDGTEIQRYRILSEGWLENYDGFTIPTPRKPEGAYTFNRPTIVVLCMQFRYYKSTVPMHTS